MPIPGLKVPRLFLTVIVSKGKVLYEKDDTGVDAQGGSHSPRSPNSSRAKPPWHDAACFRGQECAQIYLKALVPELGPPVPRTYGLSDVPLFLLPHHPTLRPVCRGLMFLSQFGMEVLYPCRSASKRQTEAAFRWTNRVQTAARAVLAIPARRNGH
jgi:hypothetical protein